MPCLSGTLDWKSLRELIERQKGPRCFRSFAAVWVATHVGVSPFPNPDHTAVQYPSCGRAAISMALSHRRPIPVVTRPRRRSTLLDPHPPVGLPPLDRYSSGTYGIHASLTLFRTPRHSPSLVPPLHACFEVESQNKARSPIPRELSRNRHQ